MERKEYKYLYKINSAEELRKLPIDALPEYCDEVRQYIIECCAQNPGHLGSSLGAVELTVALHYTLSTPDDLLIWDVGHQAYAHKIITGRRDEFSHQRCKGGIGGFPRRTESQSDAYIGGHSSVSISAALGMATANKIKGEGRRVVAVIGDGAMTGGLAFEGLNNAGALNSDMLVILNDNDMSIDANTGALKSYLLRFTTSRRYNKFKTRLWRFLSFAPWIRRAFQRAGNALKQGLLKNSNLFESLNFRYFGPMDGHDVKALIKVLSDVERLRGAKLLHVYTVKGKGYTPAEQTPTVWHAPGKFNPETGERLSTHNTAEPDRYQDVFGQTLLDIAREDERIVGVTPAMISGCSLNIMMSEIPERCFDVGIAESHAVTFSAGLATQGLIPFCNIYSSFMQRAYDNVVHDVALQDLSVVMCLDRAGLVGEDGATHHGAFDLAYMGCVPNLTIAAPMNEAELRNLMFTAKEYGHPCVIRYPRGQGTGAEWRGVAFEQLEIGRGRKLREGDDLAVLSIGHVGNFAKQAIERATEQGFSVAHYDLRFAKPLDEELLREVGRKFRRVITVEDGVIRGGVGSAVQVFMEREGYDCRVKMLGIDDTFIEHGTPSELYAEAGYNAEAIYEAITSIM